MNLTAAFEKLSFTEWSQDLWKGYETEGFVGTKIKN